MKKTILFISVVALSFVFAVSAFATSRCVNPGGTAGCYASIQSAVDDSSPGDIIYVLVGRYNEHVEISTNNLTIQGAIAMGVRAVPGAGGGTYVPADPATVIVDAYGGLTPLEVNTQQNGCEPGFNVSGTNVAIKNLTVRHSCDCNIVSYASIYNPGQSPSDRRCLRCIYVRFQRHSQELIDHVERTGACSVCRGRQCRGNEQYRAEQCRRRNSAWERFADTEQQDNRSRGCCNIE